jgi:hypothetical protein
MHTTGTRVYQESAVRIVVKQILGGRRLSLRQISPSGINRIGVPSGAISMAADR